jgi:hypothetical protein
MTISKLTLCICILLIISFEVSANDKAFIRTTCAAIVDGVRYKAICYTNEDVVIKNLKGSIVFKVNSFDDASFSKLSFTDFNGDGYKDLLIEYMTNVPAICNLALYDKASKKFVRVNGFDRYPEPHRLANTKVFYSYHRSGCADMNWDSDLFIIRNFKPVKLGNINGAECGDSGIKDGIYINKVVNDKNILYKQLPINTITKYKNYKSGFIKSYWQRHYKNFLRYSLLGEG